MNKGYISTQKSSTYVRKMRNTPPVITTNRCALSPGQVPQLLHPSYRLYQIAWGKVIPVRSLVRKQTTRNRQTAAAATSIQIHIGKFKSRHFGAHLTNEEQAHLHTIYKFILVRRGSALQAKKPHAAMVAAARPTYHTLQRHRINPHLVQAHTQGHRPVVKAVK